LQFRHIIINVQLEFNEDLDCLRRFKTLLSKSPNGHDIILNLNLGFIDSHGPEEENGLVFQKEDEQMKDLIAELIAWKDARKTVNMTYTSGCICGGVDFGVIGEAKEHLEEVCKENGIPLNKLTDYPRGWPRWYVREDSARYWEGESRYYWLHRNYINSA
jgi:hypothetical protein